MPMPRNTTSQPGPGNGIMINPATSTRPPEMAMNTRQIVRPPGRSITQAFSRAPSSCARWNRFRTGPRLVGVVGLNAGYAVPVATMVVGDFGGVRPGSRLTA